MKNSLDVEVQEVNNNELLYYFVATSLIERHSLFVRWTDDDSVSLDILFALPLPIGNPGRGFSTGDLVVAISGMSCFHFSIHKESAVTYYQEKLGIYNEKLTIFINSVRAKLLEQYNRLHNVKS